MYFVFNTSVRCISLPVVAVISLYVQFFFCFSLLSQFYWTQPNRVLCQDYSNICLDSVNLVRESRDNSELNLFVHVVTILLS